MRRRIVLIMLALFVTLCFTIVKPVAQQPVVDSQKSRQELETMEGILSTTLGYAVQRLGGNQAAEGDRAFKFHRMDGGEVNGYYVYGQGAVFMIPISALQRHQEMDFAFAMPDIDVLIEPAVKAGLEAAVAGWEISSEIQAEQAKEKSEQLQQKAEERKKELTKNMEKQKEKIQQLQEKTKQRRAEMEARRKELIGRLDQVKVDLKDALARYGDSLSIVKPEESVTIILSDERGFRWGDSEGGNICHVLTVKKSLATDLKSGKITREEFNRRVVDYSY
jgi:flagellar motility protein MotE (MotC chaperone)